MLHILTQDFALKPMPDILISLFPYHFLMSQDSTIGQSSCLVTQRSWVQIQLTATGSFSLYALPFKLLFPYLPKGIFPFPSNLRQPQLLENAKKNLVFHFGVGRHDSFPQTPVVKFSHYRRNHLLTQILHPSIFYSFHYEDNPSIIFLVDNPRHLSY